MLPGVVVSIPFNGLWLMLFHPTLTTFAETHYLFCLEGKISPAHVSVPRSSLLVMYYLNGQDSQQLQVKLWDDVFTTCPQMLCTRLYDMIHRKA